MQTTKIERFEKHQIDETREIRSFSRGESNEGIELLGRDGLLQVGASFDRKRNGRSNDEESTRANLVDWVSTGSDFGHEIAFARAAPSFSRRASSSALNFPAADQFLAPLASSPSLTQHARAAFRSTTRIFIDCDLYEGKDALYYTEPVIKRNCRARSTTTTTRERENVSSRSRCDSVFE